MQQLFFDTPNGGLIVNVPETVNLTPAERVWRGLVIQRLQDLTIRSGMVFLRSVSQQYSSRASTRKLRCLWAYCL